MEVKLGELPNPLNKMINSYGSPFYQLLFFDDGDIQTFHFTTREKAEKHAKKILNNVFVERLYSSSKIEPISSCNEYCKEEDCEECEYDKMQVKLYGYIDFIENKIKERIEYKIKENCPYDMLNDIIELFYENIYLKIEDKHFLDE